MKSINEIQKLNRNLRKDLKRLCASYYLAIKNRWKEEKRQQVFYKISILKSKIEILDWLLNDEPEASAETALSANTRLGEVPAPLVKDQAIKEVAGGLGETPAVRQNEQEKKVCTYCGAQNSCKRSHCIKCLKWIG